MSQFDEREVIKMGRLLQDMYVNQPGTSRTSREWQVLAHHVLTLLAEEREACAKVAEEYQPKMMGLDYPMNNLKSIRSMISAAIRARSKR